MTEYLTLEDLAKRWDIPYGTLVVRKHRGQLPEPDVDPGRRPMWRTTTIEAYEASNDRRD